MGRTDLDDDNIALGVLDHILRSGPDEEALDTSHGATTKNDGVDAVVINSLAQ